MTFKSIDYMETHREIQPSLYRESPQLDKLFESIFKPYEDQQKDFLWLAENILSVDLAEKWHLDWIGRLVGQERFLIDFNVEPYFGFKNSYKSETFGDKNNPNVGGYWKTRGDFNTSSARRLNDEELRRLIKARVIFNSSNCITNDLVEVVNLITNRTDNTVQTIRHGLIRIKSQDETGLLSYFIDRLDLIDNILPIADGVAVELSENN